MGSIDSYTNVRPADLIRSITFCGYNRKLSNTTKRWNLFGIGNLYGSSVHTYIYENKYLRYLDCAKPRPQYPPPSRPFYQLRSLKIAKCNKQNILYAAHVPIYEMFFICMYIATSPPTPLYTTVWFPDKVLGPLLNNDK